MGSAQHVLVAQAAPVAEVGRGAGEGNGTGRDARGARAGGRGGRAAVNAIEQLGQVVGRAVLNFVNKQLRLRAIVARPVELLDPVAHFVQVGGARGDDQQRIDALDGHDAQRAVQGVAFADDIAQAGLGGLAGAHQ